jgi:hypothetical protein
MTDTTPTAYILREYGGSHATLVEQVTPDVPYDPADRATSCAHERRTCYTVYRGLLCRTWNLSNGQGPQFSEVCAGLRSTGNTVPAAHDADVARIVQTESRRRFRRNLPIIDA